MQESTENNREEESQSQDQGPAVFSSVSSLFISVLSVVTLFQKGLP
jgi:hypothetical protein